MATIKEQFELNTENVNLATELLKVLGDREGQYVWKQFTAEGGEFISFVVADSEDAYHDGGELDGYWYEKIEVEGGLTPETFSLSKIAIDSFTPASSTVANKLTIAHSLGQTPDVILIFANNYYAKPTNYPNSKIMALFGRNNSGTKLANFGDPSNAYFHFYKQQFYWYSSKTVMGENTTLTDNLVTTTNISVNDSSYEFYGVETYTVITGAYI